MLVGLDVGTTNCKAMVMGVDGQCLGLGSVPTPWTQTPTGAQASAAALLAAALASVDEALAAAGTPDRVLGIGVTGLAESGVLLDSAGQPIAPVIAWYDTRGEEYVEQLRTEAGAPGFSATTGLSLTARPSLFKYRWLAAEHGIDAGVRWLSVPEWVAYALGGAPVTEASLAGRTGFFDVLDARPAEALLDWAGAPGELLGPLALPGQPTGRVRSDFAGLAGAAITVAGHDHLAVGVGVGATGTGDLLDSCGTSEALVRSLADQLTRERLVATVELGLHVGRHVFADRLQLMVGLQSGIGMWRFLKLMGFGMDDLDRLDAEALAVEPGPQSPVVDDIWLPHASLRNINYEPVPAAIWRAAVEAVQRQALVLKERLESVAGPTQRIVATGGGLRSEAVRVLKRRILGDYVVPEVREAGARGAAVFAAIAAGVVTEPAELAPERTQEAGPGRR